ncbi:MAG: acyl-CoA reductase, partial [Bacteroidetes bacterium]
IAIEAGFTGKIEFTSNQIKSFDAVIATGSDNSSRYFGYYFGKYPNIIRKNRNGVAIIKGDETDQDLEALADDIFQYYGLGCRNVSKIFVPNDYDFNPLLDILSEQKTIIENNKYFNNYEYNKAIFLVNSREHFDAGTVLLVEEEKIASPVSVLNFEYYKEENVLRNHLILDADKIQCVVSNSDSIPDKVAFGKSQQPELWDYADGVDTVEFLLGLAE